MNSRVRHYGLALALILAAAGLRFAMVPAFGYRYGFAFFLVSTFMAGRYLGLGPSLFALIGGTVPAIALHFMPPDQEFDYGFRVAMVLYFILGGVLVAMCHSERRVRARLEAEIARRTAVERELRDNRQQLWLIIEAAQLGIWQLDLATNHVTWSDQMELMHGFALRTFDGSLDNALKNIHPEDRALILDDVSTGSSPRRTYRIVRPDGQVRWLQGIGKTLHNDSGRPIQMLGVCFDVTDQKVSELKVSAAEEKFRTLAMHAPVGIVQTDPRGHIQFVNQAWCDIGGVSAEHALKQGGLGLLHPEDRQRCLANWKNAVRQGQDYHDEFRVVDPHGNTRWVIGSAAPMRDGAGAFIGHVGTIVDVTERRVAEDRIRVNESRLQAILDNTTAMVFMRDLQGRYLLVNRRWEELFDLPLAKVVGRKPHELLEAGLADRFIAQDQQVAETAQAVRIEETIPEADGIHTYVTAKFPIFDGAGAVVAICGMATDITDQKKTLADLEAEQDVLRHTIEVQDHQRQIITYEIHDGLVQYATGALMQLEAIRERLGSDTIGDALDTVVVALRKVVAEGRRIINGIRTPVLDDWGVIPAIQQLIEEEDRAHVEVEFIKDESLGRMNANLEEALYRITQEALTNAYKHSQSERVLVELGRHGDRVQLQVRDWGVGFVPTNGSRTVHGLRGMTNRARFAGGNCKIESTPGKGTKVTVDLPYLRKG